MKIYTENKVIDLSKYETVRYRETLLAETEGYPVEAIRRETFGGMFGGTQTVSEEIIRLEHEEAAKELVKVIAEKWANGDKLFNVEEWSEEE